MNKFVVACTFAALLPGLAACVVNPGPYDNGYNESYYSPAYVGVYDRYPEHTRTRHYDWGYWNHGGGGGQEHPNFGGPGNNRGNDHNGWHH